MNEIAKANWDLAIAWMAHAEQAEDTNTTICYTGLAECALKAAQFAVNNPALVAGEDAVPLPPGDDIGGVGPVRVPVGPTEGPRFWGST